jgi:hypothetical protein
MNRDEQPRSTRNTRKGRGAESARRYPYRPDPSPMPGYVARATPADTEIRVPYFHHHQSPITHHPDKWRSLEVNGDDWR